MPYLNSKDTVNALGRMITFESQLDKLFENFNLNLRENSGRRNMLLSQAQEVFFANILEEKGYDVTCSGKTGEPDIVINSLGKELECKMTSAKKNSWPLQCDYATLQKKGSIDFLYVLCNENFERFAVLLFENLNVDDFYPPAAGSRQKSRMNKSNAMRKCTVLHGSVLDKREKFIYRYASDLNELAHRRDERMRSLQERLYRSSTSCQRKKVSGIIDRENKRFEKRESRVIEKINFWKSSPSHYEISLLEI